jgi:hypothetical protein
MNNQNLKNAVNEIAKSIEAAEITAWEIISDALEIDGSEITVTLGGPNIWIDTETQFVYGTWAFDSYKVRYHDAIGLKSAMREVA